MDPVTGGIAATFAIVAIVLFLKMMGQSSDLANTQEELTQTQRELKKATQQLSTKSEKYNKKAQQASQTESTAKDQKNRIAGLQDDLHAAKAELGKSKDKVKSFSSEVNRLRIEREELRQALAAAKRRPEPEYAPARPSAPAEGGAADAPAPAPAPSRPEGVKATVGRLERDLERAEGDLERQASANKRLKRDLVETTAKLRAASRKNEHNRRAFVITQLQLDLLVDENYVLKHGTPPPYAQADKAAKRKALLPEEEKLVIDRDAEPIQLPSAEELDAAEAEASAPAAIIERAADRIPEPEIEPEIELEEDLEDALAFEADVELDAADEPEEQAPIEAAEAEEDVVEEAPAPADRSVKRRRKVKTEEPVGARAKPSAPPRPTS